MILTSCTPIQSRTNLPHPLSKYPSLLIILISAPAKYSSLIWFLTTIIIMCRLLRLFKSMRTNTLILTKSHCATCMQHCSTLTYLLLKSNFILILSFTLLNANLLNLSLAYSRIIKPRLGVMIDGVQYSGPKPALKEVKTNAPQNFGYAFKFFLKFNFT